MASRNFYFKLILRVLLITLTAIGFAMAFVQHWYATTAGLFIVLVIQVYALIHFINSTNRKIAYFFDAIKNEDFTLRFPEMVTIKSFKELNQSLNRVNHLIQEVHLQLQIRENYYQEILRQAKIGIMTYNEKGHILYTNPTVEKLLNHSPLNHIRQLKKIDEKLYSVFQAFKPFDRKLFQLTNEREQKQLALKSTPITLEKQNLLMVIVQDIRYELEERETDSWIRLIRVLTHEIMNSITPITSISESVLQYFKSKDENAPNLPGSDRQASAIKGLEVIKGQSNDLMEFVQSYRSLLSIPKPDKELVAVQQLFEKVQVLTGREAVNPATITWHIDPADLELFVDKKQLTQVLINLVKNAQQSINGIVGGKITVNAGVDNSNRKYIVVSDNGPGIPKELLAEVFIPFFTTKDKGTGIGLSLSRQIMHLHGGEISVRSTPHQKTTFLLTF